MIGEGGEGGCDGRKGEGVCVSMKGRLSDITVRSVGVSVMGG